MSFRFATAPDVQRLVALHQASFGAGWDTATLSVFICSDLVLVCGEPIDAFIIVRQTLDEAEIITLSVAKESRGQGKARALLSAAFEQLRAKKAASIFLEVASDNEPAIILYRSTGFAQIGRRKGYYGRKTGENVDALVMSRAINVAGIAGNN
jgi:[ribosomal protein S18]-alanine N-acetyltransferase